MQVNLTLGAPAVTFGENPANAAPQLLTPSVVLDAGLAMAGGRLVVYGLLAEDRVSVRDAGTGAGQIGVQGSTITYGGTAIGTASGGQGTALIVALNGAADEAAVTALIEHLTYANASDTPTETRELRLDLIDGTGARLGAPLQADLTFELAGTANPFNEDLWAGYYPYSLARAAFLDLDDDGRLDLVATGRVPQGLRAWKNTPDGYVAFAEADNPLSAFAGPSAYAHSPVAVDINGDGRLDLVFEQGVLRVLLNLPDGWQEATGDAYPLVGVTPAEYSIPAFLDLDEDGLLDIVMGTSNDYVRVYRNTGSGYVELTGSDNPFDRSDPTWARPGGGVIWNTFTVPTVTDLNGDGRLDLVVGANDDRLNGGVILTWLNTPEGFVGTRTGVDLSTSFLTARLGPAPVFVDLDADSRPDLVQGQYDGTLRSKLNLTPFGLPIAVSVTAENDAPTGLVSLTSFGGVLRASDTLADADGIGAVTYGWESSADGGAIWEAIPGAAGADFTPGAAEAGQMLRAVAAYTDLGGTAESVASALLAIVGTDAGEAMTAPAPGAVLFGRGGDDILTGDLGDDTLDGGTGNDDLTGGAGNDSYVVDSAGDTLREEAGAGRDTVQTTLFRYILGANLEELTYFGAGRFAASGNSLANRIEGAAKNDSLDGAGGADMLIGHGGNDVYTLDDAGDVVVENFGEGTDTVRTTLASHTLASHVERLIYTGTAAFGGTGNALGNLITGGAAADTLLGLDGADRLDGGAGGDSMVGGTGDDTYIVDNIADIVVEQAGEGFDTVITSLGVDRLAAGVERLVFAGTGSFTGTGNELANRIAGGADADTLSGEEANDVLDGGAGADSLVGGHGNDRYVVDDAADIVVELAGEGRDGVHTRLTAYSLGANVESLTYTGSAGFTGLGNTLANRITGGAADDVLTGGQGNDALSGGAGADWLDGGDGMDTLSYKGSIQSVTVDLSGAQQLASGGDAEGDVISGFENVIGGHGRDLLIGNDGANRLSGDGGTDTLRGLGGNDTLVSDGAGEDMDGGDGIDTADFSSLRAEFAQGLTLDLSGATQTARVGGFGFLTIANLEHVIGGAGFDLLRGSAVANFLAGGAGDDELFGLDGDDTLDGGTGADSMLGGFGDDTYVVDDVGDLIRGLGASDPGVDTVRTTLAFFDLNPRQENLVFTGAGDFEGYGHDGANRITGGAGADNLDGRGGADTLLGGGGADMLNGGAGTDVLTGGSGADSFRFIAGEAQGDRVNDFSAAAGDRLVFEGYGTAEQGASFVKLAGTTWQVTSFDGAMLELITLSGTPVVTAADYAFL